MFTVALVASGTQLDDPKGLHENPPFALFSVAVRRMCWLSKATAHQLLVSLAGFQVLSGFAWPPDTITGAVPGSAF